MCIYMYTLYLSGHLGHTSLDFLKAMAQMEEWVQEWATLERFTSLIFTGRENTSHGWVPQILLPFGNAVVNQHKSTAVTNVFQ